MISTSSYCISCILFAFITTLWVPNSTSFGGATYEADPKGQVNQGKWVEQRWRGCKEGRSQTDWRSRWQTLLLTQEICVYCGIYLILLWERQYWQARMLLTCSSMSMDGDGTLIPWRAEQLRTRECVIKDGVVRVGHSGRARFVVSDIVLTSSSSESRN